MLKDYIKKHRIAKIVENPLNILNECYLHLSRTKEMLKTRHGGVDSYGF